MSHTERQAELAFRQQIESDMMGGLRLLCDAEHGAPIARDQVTEIRRRVADCKALLGYA